MKRNPASILVAAVTLLMVAAYVIAPYAVDDWSYISVFRTHDALHPDWPTLVVKYMPRHWLGVNGRGANFLVAYAMAFLPKWLVSAFCGAAVGAMLALVLRLGGVWHRSGRTTLAVSTVAVILLLFPWWDWMYSVDLNFNYVVATVFPLAFLLGMRANLSPWLLCPLGLVAGCMHEAVAVPVMAGIVWLMMSNRVPWRSLPGRTRAALMCFAFGVAVVLFSPGIWGRFLHPGRGADGPMWEIVIFSAPMTLLMLALFGIALCRPASRQRFAAELRRPLGFFFVAAVVSLCFCAVSGVLGRSGWFSQIFSIIAMLLWFGGSHVRLPRPAAATVSTLMCVLSLAVCILPIPRLVTVARAQESLVSTPDGLWFGQLPDEHSQQLWLLGRVRSVEPSDTYYLGEMARYYAKSQLVPLPADARQYIGNPPTAPVSLADGSVIAPDTPPGCRVLSIEEPGFRYIGPGGDVWVCAPFTTPYGVRLYHLFPYRPFYAE